MPHHNSGKLKQKNKGHKGGKHASKRAIAKINSGKVEKTSSVKGTVNVVDERRINKRNKAKQIQKSRRTKFLMKQKISGGRLAPKTVGLVPLSASADVFQIIEAVFEGAAVKYTSPLGSDEAGRTIIGTFPKFRQRVQCMTVPREINAVMDMAKVCDVLVFIMPLQSGNEESTDEFGDTIVTCLRSQGFPGVIGCLQGLDAILNQKKKNEIKKEATLHLQHEFGQGVKICDSLNSELLRRCIFDVSVPSICWRENRSYLLADTLDAAEDKLKVCIDTTSNPSN
jgi:pre-rRNA-processing protein TSR1